MEGQNKLNLCPPITASMVADPNPADLHEFAFDVNLVCALRVRAHTREEAVTRMKDTIDAVSANLGQWTAGPDKGKPILAEVSLVTTDDMTFGPPRLYEIDGEDVG